MNYETFRTSRAYSDMVQEETWRNYHLYQTFLEPYSHPNYSRRSQIRGTKFHLLVILVSALEATRMHDIAKEILIAQQFHPLADCLN